MTSLHLRSITSATLFTLLCSVLLSLPARAAAPTVVTGVATNIVGTSATLNATVNPNGAATTAKFQYGPTTYSINVPATLTPNNDSVAHTVSVTVTGLTPAALYHFRVSATNSAGTRNGADATFNAYDAPQSGNYEVNVRNENNGVCGFNDCSLREAIKAANTDGTASTIHFAPESFDSPSTLFTTSPLILTHDVSITGPAQHLTIDADGENFDIFTVNTGVHATFDTLTIADGVKGIAANGTANITVKNCTLEDNQDAGIYNAGTATITGCTFIGSEGIISKSSAKSAQRGGGGNGTSLFNQGTATVLNSTFVEGFVGIFSVGAGNTTVTHCTVTQNEFGVMNYRSDSFSGATATLANTLVVGNDGDVMIYNAGGSKYYFDSTDLGYDGFTNSGGNIYNENPETVGLDNGLADNGGPTETVALTQRGYAVNGGVNDVSLDANGDALEFDQRGEGFPRVVGDTVDVGAYESAFAADPKQIGPDFEVNSADDFDDNDRRGGTSGGCTVENCTLREALTAANGDEDASAITFSADFDTQSSIVLYSPLPDFNTDITITGPGANLLTVSRDPNYGAFCVFTIAAEKNVTLQGLTLSGGYSYDNGGGILNAGHLTLVNCAISNNYATNRGGGVANSEGSTFTATGCLFNSNGASISGGVDFNAATGTLTNCTISGNYAGIAGGLESNDGSDVTLHQCTVVLNTGSYDGLSNSFSSIKIKNTLCSGNGNTDTRAVTSEGYNLVGNDDGNSTFLDSDVRSTIGQVRDLADNGGPTQTHALRGSSLAIQAGDPAFDGTDQTDQRGEGFARVLNGVLDIGAFESNYSAPEPLQSGPDFVVNTTDDTDDGDCSINHCSLREAINAANSNADASVITFSSLFDSAQTITLTSQLSYLFSDITITGPGADKLTILNSDNGFQSLSSTVTISGLTVQGGQNGFNDSGTLMTINDCVAKDAVLGFSIPYASPMNLTNCTAMGDLYGISNNGGQLTARNCTIVGSLGAGVANNNFYGDAQMTLTNCTVSDNSTGIAVFGGTVTLQNSLIVGNVSNTQGTVESGADSLTSGTAAEAGLEVDGDDKPILALNGGTTPNIKLLAGGTAVNAGNNSYAAGIPTDQRGAPRIQLGQVDIGAYEKANGAPTVVSVTHPDGQSTGSSLAGDEHTLTATYSDEDGGSTLRYSYLLVNNTLTTSNSVTCYYDGLTNKLYLRTDAGGWSSAVTPGAATVLQNANASLNCAQTTVTTQGTTRVIAWSLTPKAGFGGAKNLYLYTSDKNGASSGWSDLGDWTLPNSPPTTVSVTHPDGLNVGASNANEEHVLTTTYNDADGGANIRSCYLLVNSTLTTASGATCLYDAVANKLYLRLDNGAWSAGAIPGAPTVLQNSNMSLNCAQTTVTVQGTTLVIAWSLTPKTGFGGVKNLYLYATDKNSTNSGWSDLGDWTLPNATPAGASVTHPNGNSVATSSVGEEHTLTTTYSDADGGANIRFCYLLVNNILKNTGATLLYDALTNKLYLRQDDGTWGTAVTPGSATVLENSHMSLDCSQTTTQVVGTTRVVAWSLTPKAGFVGTKNLYLYATDINSANSGWADLGDWTITASADRPASTRATRSSVKTF